MADCPLVKAIKQNANSIARLIQGNLTFIANDLRSEKVLGDEHYCKIVETNATSPLERANDLLQCVITHVQIESMQYHVFYGVLEKYPNLQVLLKILPKPDDCRGEDKPSPQDLHHQPPTLKEAPQSVQQAQEDSSQAQNTTANPQEIQQLRQENCHPQGELHENDEVLQQKIRLSWRVCKAAPHVLFRGSSTVCGSIAYFRPKDDSGEVLAYNSKTEEWFTPPKCPTQNFTLTVVNGLVTAVGGRHNKLPYACTHRLFSLKEERGRKIWLDHFPPMPTKRKFPVVACSGKTLVVAGGKTEYFVKLTTVEVMDTDTLQWSTVSSLPQALSEASATVCGDRVYVVGGYRQGGLETKTAFTCSMSALLQSRNYHEEWQKIADLPVLRSTCVTLSGELLAVGGTPLAKSTRKIYLYNTETNSWDVISKMFTKRQFCLVTVLPDNKLMVVGGRKATDFPIHLNTVEIATLQ